MDYYELLQQNPSAFILYVIKSFVITVVAYGVFPILFAMLRKKDIVENRYSRMSFTVNFLVCC
ncbi:MAG: hypothetical protein IJC54_02280, partial [Clostridia bacterium]|nr:hypothetical protein [Clostridia bacterium]